MITEKNTAQKSQHFVNAGFQSRTQTTSVTLSPKKGNTGTTESMSPTEVTGNSIPIIPTLMPGIIIPLQLLTKTFRKQFYFS